MYLDIDYYFIILMRPYIYIRFLKPVQFGTR